MRHKSVLYGACQWLQSDCDTDTDNTCKNDTWNGDGFQDSPLKCKWIDYGPSIRGGCDKSSECPHVQCDVQYHR